MATCKLWLWSIESAAEATLAGGLLAPSRLLCPPHGSCCLPLITPAPQGTAPPGHCHACWRGTAWRWDGEEKPTVKEREQCFQGCDLKNPSWRPDICQPGKVSFCLVCSNMGPWQWETLPSRDFVFALEELPVPSSVDARKAAIS